jgi:hypothetical protein
MTEAQKKKQKFRTSKEWKNKKVSEKERAGGKDEITLKPLRKNWTLHHQNLDEEFYEDMAQDFLCCNNKTHSFIHWLFVYYIKDPLIIDRIRAEMEKMKKNNNK